MHSALARANCTAHVESALGLRVRRDCAGEATERRAKRATVHCAHAPSLRRALYSAPAGRRRNGSVPTDAGTHGTTGEGEK